MRQFFVILAVLFFVPCFRVAPAHAERKRHVPLPAEQLDDEAKLTLARAMVGEADWHEPDHRAIAWVLAKRFNSIETRKPGKTTFSELVAKYASPLKTKTERTQFIQTLPWGDPTSDAYKPFAKHWAAVRELVERWAAGDIPDPCPRAKHWGGAMDRPKVKLQPVNCGLTRNIFYEEPATRS